MQQDHSTWVTVEEAATRCRVSTATIRRYAGSADQDVAVQVPIRAGGTKMRWLLQPEALDTWSRRSPQGRLPTPTSPLANTTADAPREVPASKDTFVTETDLDMRLTAVEHTLRELLRRLDRISGLLVDDTRAARTAALVEKGVAEELRATQRAQRAADAARKKAFEFQVQATQQALLAESLQQDAVEAMGRSLDRRSAQLDEIFVPGSGPRD